MKTRGHGVGATDVWGLSVYLECLGCSAKPICFAYVLNNQDCSSAIIFECVLIGVSFIFLFSEIGEHRSHYRPQENATVQSNEGQRLTLGLRVGGHRAG